MTPGNYRLRTVVTLVPVLVASTGLSLGGLWLARQYLSQELLRASNDVVGNYLQTIGSVYAVLLAFVVFVVWTQFNETRAQVEREANELVDLFRTSGGFPDAERSHLHDHLRRYVDTVLDEEWKAMRVGDEACIERTSKILDDAWKSLKSFEPVSGCHSVLYGEVLSRFNDLSDLRTIRLTSSRQRIPFAMKLLLYIGAVLVVASMWLFAVESFALHALITGAIAGAVAHVLFLIHDLDDCFDGAWQVSRAGFERTRRYMAAGGNR